jgi:hypothetical protein
MNRAATHFVVSRRNWRYAGRTGLLVLMPGEARVAVFPTAAEADADARVREAEARRKVNPFRFGATWADRSHLPEPLFCDFLRDAGIEIPDEKDRDWAKWWESTGAALSAAQRERVWEGLDRVRFFAVAERPERPVVYAVVEVKWNFNDQWYYPGPEGGEVQVAYRSRDRAEQECERRNAEARAQWRQSLRLPEPGSESANRWEGHELYPFHMEGRLFETQDPFGGQARPPTRTRNGVVDRSGYWAVEEVPFFEVIEFELGEDG